MLSQPFQENLCHKEKLPLLWEATLLAVQTALPDDKDYHDDEPDDKDYHDDDEVKEMKEIDHNDDI